MSKVFYAIAIYMSLIASVSAQQASRLPVACSSIANGLDVISSFKEAPIFMGKDEQHDIENLSLVIFLNKETKTFTAALVSKDQNRFCAISSGTGVIIPKTETKH